MKTNKELLFIITVGVAVLIAVIIPFFDNNINDNSIVQVGKQTQSVSVPIKDNSIITILPEKVNDDMDIGKSLLRDYLFPFDYQPLLGQNNDITVLHVTVANSDEDNDSLVKTKTEGTCVGITIRDILIRVVSLL